MEQQKITHTPYEASRIVYGCMGIGGGWNHDPLDDVAQNNAIHALEAALDSGINFFDHADIYCFGKSEQAFAKLIAQKPHLRNEIIVQSKCGIRIATENYVGHYDFSREHIVSSVEESLQRLQTNYLDILLLHRPDILVEGEEVAAAFSELHSSGKVRFFGVSNHTPMQIEYLRKCLDVPIIVNQIQLSVLHSDVFNSGIAGSCPVESIGCSGLVEYCRFHGITLQAWGPLAAGKIFEHNSSEPRVAAVQKVLHKLAEKYNTNPTAIAIAWILRHPAQIQAVIGSGNPERIRNACEAVKMELTRCEWYELFICGRGEALP